MLGRNGFTCARISSKFLCRQQEVGWSVNHLYSPAFLGVTNFEDVKHKVKHQFQHLEDKFKDKMTEFADPAATSATIFTEDLKHMVHLAGESDLLLVKNMMTKFANQNKDLRFGSFVFGPVVMRMYYSLNKPLEALEAFNDPQLDGFFDQIISFNILMDLLLKNGHYDEILTVFERVKSKQLQGAKYPKNVVVLVFAALYKKNDAESLKYAKKLWSELNAVGHYPMRRAATFASALALNQNEPAVAIEVLTNVKKQSYVTVRNLKVIALADLGRPDDALPIIRNVLEFGDSSGGQTHTFFRETLNKMAEAVQKMNSKELTDDFDAVAAKLNTLKLVIDTSLDDQLCVDIEPPIRRDLENSNGPFRRDNRSGGTNWRSNRPGVMGLV